MTNTCSQVYYTSEISDYSLLRIYNFLGFQHSKKVAVKVHSGEPGGHYFLNPSLIAPLVKHINGTIIDANTPYEGHRTYTTDHYNSMKCHGFCDIATCDIIDKDGSSIIPVPNGKRITVNYVGSHLLYYDSIIILNHFKGHKAAGFGGVLKDMSIGLASKEGKCWIHTAGQSLTDVNFPTKQEWFLESMADAAKSIQVLNMPMAFISFLNNLSADGDGCSNPSKPEIDDQGIFASFDPVALDQACLDIIRTRGQQHNKSNCELLNRIAKLNGEYTIKAARKQAVGSILYELINIDND